MRLLKSSTLKLLVRHGISYSRCVSEGFSNKYSTITKPEQELIAVKGVNLNKYIQSLENEYNSLTKNQVQNHRYVELQSIMKVLQERRAVVENINNLKELLSSEDKEMKQLAEEEKKKFETNLNKLDNNLIESLIPLDKEDACDTMVLEVQAGVGGQEAMLFAKELFDMYSNFAQYKGWQLDLAEYLTTDVGGLRNAIAIINGKQSYRYFKHEAGIHRVQRIPATEKGGRVHTSTASVIAMPQPSEVEVKIDPKDLRIETKRSSGAGGQHVNKTESAVRITHLPTGVSVECQVDRSQIKNRKMAMARLSAILYDREQEALRAQIESTKKSQVKTKNRNEKIRTYNYNQNRVTDHRYAINVHNLQAFLEGGQVLEELITEIDGHYRLENLFSLVNNAK
ncbi:unnamed protein product [Acanthoscelides obtectus]|uniref:Prokaryotic-type class I peptide chain release factors domain-containing protein n=1 Tax=Acanthoscelides obtectus TaxID=200917 RepID=A0A9P0P009_ACAOB|nr:unnamed protein product [Acanthoscelides obtectus]CAK1629723.1 Peptide chain release factor 1-like, mitochondrial [Acanthoscelides obtectus]